MRLDEDDGDERPDLPGATPACSPVCSSRARLYVYDRDGVGQWVPYGCDCGAQRPS